MSYRDLWRAVVLEAEFDELYGADKPTNEFLREIHYDNLALAEARRRLAVYLGKELVA